MPIGPDIVAAVAQRLADRAGLELPAWVVEARTTARIAALALSPPDYVALIESASPRGASELDELIEAVRVGETRLFRHRSQITALVDDIAPQLRTRSRKRAIRVWSAGCANGEEPYTLAIVLSRALAGMQIQITATDVSADALAVAARASYPLAALSDVPEEWRDGFVVERDRDGDRVRVRPEIANLVRFERANLIDGVVPRACDLVWCRNVLIYFTVAARRRAIDRLVSALAPGGYLFVGYSESLREVTELEVARGGEATYYIRRDVDPTSPQRPIGGTLVVHGVPRTPPSGVPKLSLDESRTPAPRLIPDVPPADDVLVLRGTPEARVVTTEITARLGIAGLRTLTIDLDSAELLADELAPVIRRARAAANAAHVVLRIRATRTGAKRWLARHALDG